MQRTLVTAQILGIQGVPFIVANDGRISRGRPYDLSAWLEGVNESLSVFSTTRFRAVASINLFRR